MNLNLLCDEYHKLAKIIPNNIQYQFLCGTITVQDYVRECEKILKKIILCQRQIKLHLTRNKIIQKKKKKWCNAYWKTYSYK